MTKNGEYMAGYEKGFRAGYLVGHAVALSVGPAPSKTATVEAADVCLNALLDEVGVKREREPNVL